MSPAQRRRSTDTIREGRRRRSACSRVSNVAPSELAVESPSERSRRPWAAVKRLNLLGPVRCSGTELAVVASFFGMLAVAVFGVYVTRGGLSFDDWTLAYDIDRLVDSDGFPGAFKELMSGDILTGNMAGRPVEAGYYLIVYSAFGQHAGLHLAAAVFFAALVAFLFYVVLRLLQVERLHAAAIGSLVLLFPAADSTVFWATGAIAHVTIALYLAGAICSIRALRMRDGAALGLYVLGICLYTASILQYQIAAPFVFLSVFVYRFAGASWRRALKPWIAAVIVGLVALLYVKANLPRQTGSLSDDFRHARDIAGGARQLLASLGIQDGPQRMPAIATLALLVVAGALAFFLPSGDVVRHELRRWLLIATAGFATIGAAYSIFIPGDFYYWPLAHGIGNRANAAAGLGFAIVLYSLLVLFALIVVRALRLKPAVGTAAAMAFAGTLALLALFIPAVNSDRQPYEQAADLQREALAVAKNDIPRPAHGMTVYLFGIDNEIAPNVFTFVRPNDVTAALRLLWDDDTIEGVSVSSTAVDWPGNTKANSGMSCGSQGVQPRGWLFTDYSPSRYGKTLFVDVRTRTSELIRSEESCGATLSRYLPQSRSDG
jgi:hypothetical protein